MIFSRADVLSLSVFLSVCSVLEMSTSMKKCSMFRTFSHFTLFRKFVTFSSLLTKCVFIYERFNCTKSRVFVAATVSSIHCTEHKVLNVVFLSNSWLFSFYIFEQKAIFRQRNGFGWRAREAEQNRENEEICIHSFHPFSLSILFYFVAFCNFGCIFVESKHDSIEANQVIKYSINFDTTRYGRLITIIMWLFHCASAKWIKWATLCDHILGVFLFCSVIVAIPLSACVIFCVCICIELTDEFVWCDVLTLENILRLYHSMTTNWVGFAVAINVDCCVDIFSWLFIKFDIYMRTWIACCCLLACKSDAFAHFEVCIHVYGEKIQEDAQKHKHTIAYWMCVSIGKDKRITRHFYVMSESRQKERKKTD